MSFNPFSLAVGAVSWKFKVAAILLAVAALGSLYAWRVHVERDIGRAEVQLKWDAVVSQQRAAALAESESNARETLRRLTRQKENQDAQNAELAAARSDAARNDAAAGKLRTQLADTAKRWRDALGDSPTGGNCATAGDAIGVLADVLGRADRRAGILATYADAARVAGLKCERDYDALGK